MGASMPLPGLPRPAAAGSLPAIAPAGLGQSGNLQGDSPVTPTSLLDTSWDPTGLRFVDLVRKHPPAPAGLVPNETRLRRKDRRINNCRLSLRESSATFSERKATM